MQLTKFSDYALRVLMYTHAAAGRRVTIEEIAGAYRIFRAHLMKVVNSLARAGYLTAHRGRCGGIVLGRPAERYMPWRGGAGDRACLCENKRPVRALRLRQYGSQRTIHRAARRQ